MLCNKITKGLYKISSKGRVFEVEDIGQASNGEVSSAWMLYELVGDHHAREFLNDYSTKREAIRAIENI